MGGEKDVEGRRAFPGSFLLHPVALASIAALLLNDLVLKRSNPSWVTGKLSDVAGVILLPLVFVAAYEVVRRPRMATTKVFVAAAAVTFVGLCAVKLMPPVADAYQASLSWLRWLAVQPIRFALGRGSGGRSGVAVVDDPTDALVAGFAFVAVWVGTSTRRPTPATSERRGARDL